MVFSVWSVLRSYNQEDLSNESESSAMEAEKRWRYSSVDSAVVGYSPDNNNMNTEAEESLLLRAVTKQ
jgi:hypothetical protein